jgi:hypothetical protein
VSQVLDRDAHADTRGAAQVIDRGALFVARGAARWLLQVLSRGSQAVARGAARCASQVFDRGAQAVARGAATFIADNQGRQRRDASAGEEQLASAGPKRTSLSRTHKRTEGRAPVCGSEFTI